MKSLDEIAIESGTDKSSLSHAYCQYYQMFLDPLREKEINLLEVGIDAGSSVKMWREYFQKGEIHGIDIRGDYEYLHELGIKTHIVDQSSHSQLLDFGNKFNEYFDLIILDGSHNGDDDILSFNTLFPFLKNGGLFVIEDALCSAVDTSRWGKNGSVYERVYDMIGDVNMGWKTSPNHLCANKKKEMHRYEEELNYYQKYIEWVFNSMSLIFIKKMKYETD